MSAKTKNFNIKTDPRLACSHTGKQGVQQWALDKLQEVRDKINRPMTITSAYRDETHPVEARKSKPGTHNQGIAFDISVSSGAERYELIKAAIECGATGIGVNKTFIHMDWRDSTPVSWEY